MKILTTDTNVRDTLSLIDPANGVDFVQDYIGNTGALGGQFVWDDDEDAYLCDDDTYRWWLEMCQQTQELEDRLHALRNKHGADEVNEVMLDTDITYAEFSDVTSIAMAVLDDTYGADDAI